MHRKVGVFFSRFVMLTGTHVGWLIILTPGVGWDIMVYESEPPPFLPQVKEVLLLC